MDAVIATTEASAGFVPYVRAVVPHGVDTDRFAPATDRARAWAATGFPGQAGVATIGRIRPEKGTDRFVDAMLRLLPDHPGLTALVIGRAARADAAFLQDLKARAAAAGLQDRLLFPGEIAANALPALLRALSAVVQLPRYEGFGMAPLEGMASGAPFVASDAGYYRSFACDGTTGIITDGEGADTAAALSALLGDTARHAEMARAAREATVTRFSIQTEADGIARVYEMLWQQG